MLPEVYRLELQLSNNSDSTLNKFQRWEADYKETPGKHIQRIVCNQNGSREKEEAIR